MEIIDEFYGFIQTTGMEELRHAFSIMYTLFGILATIVTCIGVSLIKIFLSILDFKNRKTVKYIICTRVLGKLNKNFWLKCLVPIGEIIWFSLTPCIMLVIIYIILVFVNMNIICTSNGEKSNIIVFILLMGVLTAGFLGKKLKQCRKDNYIKVIFLIGYSLFLFIVCSVFLCSAQQLLRIVAVISIGIEIFIIYNFYKWVVDRYYRHTFWNIMSRYIRCVIIIMTIFSLIKGNTNYLMIFYWLCFSLILFEYIINTDDNMYADIIIHTVEGDKVTKRHIMQYENNRVKYELKDGTTEIVEEDDILYISYQLLRMPQIKFLEKFRKKTKIKCILKNDKLDEILSYNIKSYKFVGESWIGLKIEQPDKEEKVIINVNRIKKLTEQKII